MTTNFEASLTEKEDFVGNEMDFDYNWSTNAAQTSSGEYNFGGEGEEDEEVAGSDTRKLDFQFVDTVGTCSILPLRLLKRLKNRLNQRTAWMSHQCLELP